MSTTEIALRERAALRAYPLGSLLETATQVVSYLLLRLRAWLQRGPGHEEGALLCIITSAHPPEGMLALLKAIKQVANTTDPHVRGIVNHVVTRAIQGTLYATELARWCMGQAAAALPEDRTVTTTIGVYIARQLLDGLAELEEADDGLHPRIGRWFECAESAGRPPREFLAAIRSGVLSYDDLFLSRRVSVVLRRSLVESRFYCPEFDTAFNF